DHDGGGGGVERALPDPGLNNFGEFGWRIGELQGDAVVQVEGTFVALGEVGLPEGIDVVDCFGVHAEGVKHHGSGGPFVFRLDPGGGAKFVAGLQIFVVGEIPVTLHEAESSELGGGKDAGVAPR